MAYLVAAAHGLNTSACTFAYTAGWAGTDLATVRQTAETVPRTRQTW